MKQRPSERIKELAKNHKNFDLAVERYVHGLLTYLDEQWMKDKCKDYGMSDEEADIMVEKHPEKEGKLVHKGGLVGVADHHTETTNGMFDPISKQKVLQLIEEMADEDMFPEYTYDYLVEKIKTL